MAVQISGNDITVPRDGSFTRNVTIGGTLTYEDVTNIDSVGLVTARTGIEIGARPGVAASISVDGNMIVSGISTFGGDVQVPDKIIHSGDTNTAIRFAGDDIVTIETGGSERVRVDSAGLKILDKLVHFGDVDTSIRFPAADTITAETGGSERVRIDSSGRMGIGDDSPDRELVVKHASSNSTIKIESANTHTSQLMFADSDGEQVGRVAVFHGSGQVTSNSLTLDTAGTARIRVEPAGNVNVSQNLNVAGVVTATSFSGSSEPAFRTGLIAATTAVSHNNNYTIPFDTDSGDGLFDTNSCFDTSTHRFTPSLAGYYYLHFQIRVDLGSADHLFQARIKHSSGEYIVINEIFNKSANNNGSNSCSCIQYFNGSSDYVTAEFYQNSGYSINIYGGTTYHYQTFFEGHFVRSA